MKRIQKIGIYAVCFCLCVACSADSPFDDWGENETDGGTNPGGSSGSSDASGTLLDFDVSWEDIADNSYVEIAETIITDKNDDEYDDFIENSSFASSIQIAYANGSATVTGSVSGVTVTTNGAHVTVNASVAGVEYVLSGSASNGSFKVYSDKKFKLTLAGVSLTNDSGAAINIQSGKRVFVEVKTETENYLADASSYSTVTGEDEKGCFFSEGQLIFSGTGALTVTGNYKHGICSDDYVRLRSGSNITVASAAKDGNDPNGMVYKDGVYHLFYQYNPYGSMWGNMHWGHATSTDLVNWEHQPIAIAPDALGTIFSGSCVVDKDNTAGFGAGAIIAFYTSASDRQVQSMAYSLDNGKTFKKYARNPILTSTQRDFRDPKVFWHDATDKWIMILAVGQEMQIYSSANLKDWAYESSFGEGQGAHGGVWECPDLIELPIEGTELKKWVLICNINPGGPFGGSATQYFVGTFDGKKFVNESPKNTKWMDWGKDHYATVTWSNAPEGRHIALAWMSNWQYANNVPTTQYRSGNSVPRDLSLYTSAGETYLKSSPSRELLKLRGKEEKKHSFKVDRTYNMDKLLSDNTGTYEIEMTIKNRNAEVIGFQLFNSKGEEVDIYYNLVEKKFAMDRSKSGVVSFSSDFPVLTLAPIEGNSEMTLRLFVDKSSLEAFGDDGRFAMTNLVFPSEPYNRISFYAKGGSYAVSSFKVYKLK